MRPVLMSSEGHWDKQALVCAVVGVGGRVEEKWGLGIGDSQALLSRWLLQLQCNALPLPPLFSTQL